MSGPVSHKGAFMILSMALMVASAQVAPAEPAPDEEIVVTAERARKMRYFVGVGRRGGPVVCKVRRSSGDPILDKRICEAVRSCVPPDVTEEQRDEVRACVLPLQADVVRGRAAELRAERLRQ